MIWQLFFGRVHCCWKSWNQSQKKFLDYVICFLLCCSSSSCFHVPAEVHVKYRTLFSKGMILFNCYYAVIKGFLKLWRKTTVHFNTNDKKHSNFSLLFSGVVVSIEESKWTFTEYCKVVVLDQFVYNSYIDVKKNNVEFVSFFGLNFEEASSVEDPKKPVWSRSGTAPRTL